MPDSTLHFHVEPFEGANLQPEALAFNGIDPTNPLRGAVSEYDALHAIFKLVRKGMKEQNCNRAIMVAHNATFDHSFMMAAAERSAMKRNPFHPFVTFDTASLSGLALVKPCFLKPVRPPASLLTPPRHTRRCMTRSRPHSCFVKSLTAGSGLAAGRCRRQKSIQKPEKKPVNRPVFY